MQFRTTCGPALNLQAVLFSTCSRTPTRINRQRCYIKTRETEDELLRSLRERNEPDQSPVVSTVEEKEFSMKIMASKAFRRILLELSSLPKSMGVLAVIAALSGLGTIIDQERSADFYIENYPEEGKKVLGFLTYKIVFFLQLDRIFTAPYFYFLICLLVAQLMACTYTRQLPIFKVARKWSFAKNAKTIAKKENAQVLPDANIRDLGVVLDQKGYEIFLKDGKLYGFRSLVGRLAPMGVHAALLITIAGMTWGTVGGFKGSVMIPEGRDVVLGNYMKPHTFVAIPPSGAYRDLKVESFNIEYNGDGSVSQFFTNVSLNNEDGRTLAEKMISVNHPLRYEGVTIYQTDWGLSGVILTVESPAFPEGKQTVKFPMASLASDKNQKGKLYATYVPSPDQDPNSQKLKGASILAKDFQTVVIYDADGKFVGVRRPGSGKSIETSGMKITVEDLIGSTGLELKHDPGVPLVYAGFAFLMVTTVLSYLSHSQVWAVQEGSDVHVAGKSNRAGYLFQKEFFELLDSVPDASARPANSNP